METKSNLFSRAGNFGIENSPKKKKNTLKVGWGCHSLQKSNAWMVVVDGGGFFNNPLPTPLVKNATKNRQQNGCGKEHPSPHVFLFRPSKNLNPKCVVSTTHLLSVVSKVMLGRRCFLLSLLGALFNPEPGVCFHASLPNHTSSLPSREDQIFFVKAIISEQT